jgi:hypothetical protein
MLAKQQQPLKQQAKQQHQDAAIQDSTGAGKHHVSKVSHVVVMAQHLQQRMLVPSQSAEESSSCERCCSCLPLPGRCCCWWPPCPGPQHPSSCSQC